MATRARAKATQAPVAAADESPRSAGGAEFAAESGLILPLFAPQRAQLAQLLQRRQRLAHALLIAGGAAIGKSQFVLALAQALLCEGRIGEAAEGRISAAAEGRVSAAAAAAGPIETGACGRCAACGWFVAGNHPDFRLIGLTVPGEEKASHEIAIDRIRELDTFARLSPFRGGARVVAIDPADALNSASSNALLKLLEEPGPATHLLLVSSRPERLAATVRSRTQRVDLSSPSLDEARAWLMATAAIDGAQADTLLGWVGGAPLHAQALADPGMMATYRAWVSAIASLPEASMLAVAEQLAGADIAASHGLLLRWVTDLVRVRTGARPKFFRDATGRLRELAPRCDELALLSAVAELQSQTALVRHPLNPKLFLEQALIRYGAAFGQR